MQTILGGGGTIGTVLAQELSKYTDQIRIVSRNPKKINDTDQLFPADLSDVSQVKKAIEGSEVVYLTVGFDYSRKVWREKWPPLMAAVIEGCIEHQAKLVFFDNVYLYDRNAIGHMTEESAVNPSSEKGKVRAEIAGMIMDNVKRGDLTALIARSADFYGPHNEKSVLVESVVNNFKKGKPADWFARLDKTHTFTFTPDAAKATALLGNTADAFNQIWHLPTDPSLLTGKEWIEMFATAMTVAPKSRALPIWMMGILGLFIPILSEFKEMAYQYDRDYFFDSSKFMKRFPDFKVTTPQEGVKATLEG
jgi:nucleoside-diphosphate-sugar epimerase